MAVQSKHVGYYKLKQFKIYQDGKEPNEIASMVPEFYITESMENDCIRGHATIVDKASLLESFPLRGEERILIEVEDVENQSHSYDMFLYKIDNVDVLPSNDGLTYMIHFCSFTRFISGLSRVCKSYNDHIHNIVSDIFDNNYNIHDKGFQDIIKNYGKLSEPSSTDSLQHIVIPNMFPNQAIEFVTRRAYSDQAKSSSFRFFENTEGYHFLNDEDAFRRSPEPMDFTFYDSSRKDGLNFKQQRHNLLDLQNNKRVNTITDISSGAYRNDVVEIDIIKKEVVTKSYVYKDELSDVFRPSGMRSVDHHTDSFASNVFNDDNARKFMVIRTNKAELSGSLDPNDHLSEMISSKVAYRYHLDKMQISAVAPGHMNLTCAQLINLKIYQILGERTEVILNEQLSGLYLVRSITREFVRDNYRDVLILSKANWEERNVSMDFIPS